MSMSTMYKDGSIPFYPQRLSPRSLEGEQSGADEPSKKNKMSGISKLIKMS